jgi:hypothetical protein
MITGLRTSIWTLDLPNTKQECYLLIAAFGSRFVVGSVLSITAVLFVSPQQDEGCRMDPAVVWVLSTTNVVFPTCQTNTNGYYIISNVEEVSLSVYSNLKSGDQLERLGWGKRIMFRGILEKWSMSVEWIELAPDRSQRRDLVNTVMNLRIPYRAGHFLTRWATTGLSKVLFSI